MEKKAYITNRFRNILNETLEKRADEVLEKLNLNKEVPFNKPGNPFDYVEEREICSECGGYRGGEMIEGQMCECGSMNEELKGGQKKLDVAKPYGKLTKDDFEKLRKGVRKHMEEKECMECGSMEEEETSEGNAFTEKLKQTPKGGKFKLGNKEYIDSSSLEESKKDKFIQKATSKMEKKGTEGKFGSWCKRHGLASEDGEVTKKCIDKAMKSDDSSVVKMANFAKNIGGFHGAKHKKKVDETLYRINVDGETALFTEDEMIDVIENIVNEEKNNIKMATIPKGMAEYQRVHKADKKEEDQYFKDLAKKMSDYTKDMSEKESKYEKETQKFPTENGGKRKKYTPSEAVDDYNDAFTYPGQTNLRYEIKPNDEWMEANLVGSSKTGNAQVDEDGNALGNVVPSDTGEKFLNNYKNNYYGDEQANASYKRQTQPVDQAGEHTESGSLKSKRGKKTAQSILNKVDESITTKEKQKLSEEFNRMQKLMGYNHKTQ